MTEIFLLMIQRLGQSWRNQLTQNDNDSLHDNLYKGGHPCSLLFSFYYSFPCSLLLFHLAPFYFCSPLGHWSFASLLAHFWFPNTLCCPLFLTILPATWLPLKRFYLPRMDHRAGTLSDNICRAFDTCTRLALLSWDTYLPLHYCIKCTVVVFIFCPTEPILKIWLAATLQRDQKTQVYLF